MAKKQRRVKPKPVHKVDGFEEGAVTALTKAARKDHESILDFVEYMNDALQEGVILRVPGSPKLHEFRELADGTFVGARALQDQVAILAYENHIGRPAESFEEARDHITGKLLCRICTTWIKDYEKRVGPGLVYVTTQ